MAPEYARQIDRLIEVLSQRDTVPTWVVSAVSVVVGAILSVLLNMLKEHRDHRARVSTIERALCGDLLLNYSQALGMLTVLDFERVDAGQLVFDGVFIFDAIENARPIESPTHEVPHYAEMRTLFKAFKHLSDASVGGHAARSLVVDVARHFENFFVKGDLNRQIILDLCTLCAPRFKPRLQQLAMAEIKPGERL